jgi:hypothetical protein
LTRADNSLADGVIVTGRARNLGNYPSKWMSPEWRPIWVGRSMFQFAPTGFNKSTQGYERAQG